MRMKRYTLVALAVLCTSLATLAQTPWPPKPITLVVGSAPGGSNDTFACAIAKRLQDALGQPVLVENKAAGGGVIANALIAKSPPDGYSLVVLSSAFSTGAAKRLFSLRENEVKISCA